MLMCRWPIFMGVPYLSIYLNSISQVVFFNNSQFFRSVGNVIQQIKKLLSYLRKILVPERNFIICFFCAKLLFSLYRNKCFNSVNTNCRWSNLLQITKRRQISWSEYSTRRLTWSAIQVSCEKLFQHLQLDDVVIATRRLRDGMYTHWNENLVEHVHKDLGEIYIWNIEFS